MNAITSLNKQQGQSMAELIVAMMALLPFFLIVPYLARMIDLSQTATIASRYAAFSALDKETDEEEKATKITQLFFNSDNSEAPKHFIDPVTKTPLFANNTQSQHSRAYTMEETIHSQQGLRYQGSNTMAQFYYRLHDNKAPVDVHQGIVELELNDLPEKLFFDIEKRKFASGMRRYTAIQHDPWYANGGPDEVASRIAAPGPHYARTSIGSPETNADDLITCGTIQPLLSQFSALGDNTPSMQFARYDVEHVPTDRLNQPYTAYARNSGCLMD